MSGGQDEATHLVTDRDACWDGAHWQAWPHSMTSHPTTGELLQVVYGACCRHITEVDWNVGGGPQHRAVIEPQTGIFLLGAHAPRGEPINVVATVEGAPTGVGATLHISIPTRAWTEEGPR